MFEALTTDRGRESFWAEHAPQVGDEIHFSFVNGVYERARIVRIEPSTRFEIEYFGAQVVFEVASADDGGTDVTLITTGFAPEDREELLAGWLNVLLPMKAAIDHGVDLRNHDPTRTWERGWADQ